MVNAQYIIALSEIEIAPKTTPGNSTTHSLLNDLTICQARRMRGLDVLVVTYHLLLSSQRLIGNVANSFESVVLAFVMIWWVPPD
jgi:hypothetical protein